MPFQGEEEHETLSKNNILYPLTVYIQRNGSATYSLKLDERIQRALNALCRQPEMGEKTTRKGIRRFVVENYALFYRFDTEELIVEAIIDGRRNVSLD